MKQDKQLKKIILNSVQDSFSFGRLLESQVVKNIKLYKSLPTSKAILALTEYLTGVKRKLRKHTLVVETNCPLSLKQVEKIKRIVAKKYQITKLESKINPDILGGVRLRMGDDIYDESIQSRITQLREVLEKEI
ncbi:F0F1 ATP synthase subunit delta [Candidatus Daviesbacteria bacterium]|nr:F0F1 ATP synthase subunit delta [Candidatus Daviesbacteria bacterium]